MAQPLGPVTIGAREIYDELLRLRATLDVLVAQHGDTAEQVRDHETRLRTVEGSRWPSGQVGTLISLAAVVIAAAALIKGVSG